MINESSDDTETFLIVDIDIETNKISQNQAGCRRNSCDLWTGAANLIPLDPSRLVLRILVPTGRFDVQMKVFGPRSDEVSKKWVDMGKAGWTLDGVEHKVYLLDLLAQQRIVPFASKTKTRPIIIPPRMRLVVPEHIDWLNLGSNILYLEGLATRYAAQPCTRVITITKPTQLLKHVNSPFGISYQPTCFAQLDSLWESSVPYQPPLPKPQLGPAAVPLSKLEAQSIYEEQLLYVNIFKYLLSYLPNRGPNPQPPKLHKFCPKLAE